MRRKRRVELHIEHREISIFAGHGPPPEQTFAAPNSDTSGLIHSRNALCPTCGSPDLLLLTDAVAQANLDFTTLNQGMQDGSVHFHRSPSGEWWICKKSLNQP